MKPSEYLKNQAGSVEVYWQTFGRNEQIPKEMDKMFISKDKIRSRLRILEQEIQSYEKYKDFGNSVASSKLIAKVEELKELLEEKQ